ncbi:MAG TPA: hypothetical protein VFW98_12460 [Gemmatimonadaceae bacterium]|nr:hypothetical protein [Gemmatimonadaceae bacterium]
MRRASSLRSMRLIHYALARSPRAVAAALALAVALTPAASASAQQRRRGARRTAAAARPAADSAKTKNPSAGLHLRSIGPGLISGRISDIAVDPQHKTTWYIGTASGGLWKTTNAGVTFTPIFDHEGSYSIGRVVVDPKNPNIVWVGTGEDNAQRSVSYGDGVYKTIDGGRSWKNMGLKASEHIGRIAIDPRNSDVVYVAAQGPLWSGGGDRGLFKTTDGGATWKKVLDGGAWAGASDVVLDPRNPDVVIATTWQRIRREWGYIAGGPESAIYRSTDGGATWKKSESGLPREQLGRIGLAISPADPDIVYAIVEAANDKGGFFRSRDDGVSWQKMGDYTAIGLYYQALFPDPVDVNRVYSGDVQTMVTDDGGKTFTRVGERDKHPDNHVVWIDPDNTEHLLIGCDGGLYETFDRGQTYRYFANLPLAQFYRVDTDNSLPYFRVYGGVQDNSTVGGPSATRTDNGITNRDWFFTAGGDGFQTRVDPTDPNTVYSQSQNGSIERFNLKTGERVDVRPQPDSGQPGLRWFWDSPLIISPFSHTRLYFAANKLFRSDDRGNTWRAVSPDLTRQIDRNKLKMMGRVWGVDAVAKNTSTSLYGSIVAVAESPLKEGLLWVGTDDGLIQVSPDGGATWRKIENIPGAPDTAFVSRVTPSSHDTNTVYAVFDNHKSGDFKPYVFKSTDLGHTWTSISSNLPERGTVYVVIDDPIDPDLLYAGTEFGLYYTADGGKQWAKLGSGMPTIQVRDLEIQKRDDALVVATFGRGFYVLDNLATLRALTPKVLASDATLFPVKRTPLFVRSRPLGGSGAGWQGSAFYTASNPPSGAQFVYYLKDALQTRRARRQKAEKAAARKGEDVFYPSWDSLRVEDREIPPAMLFTVTDAEGHVVRRLTGPTGAGVQHVSWDLRYPSPNPPTPPSSGGRRGGGGGFRRGGAGPYVLPGTYHVAMAKRVDGVVTALGEPQTFQVYLLDSTASPRSPAVLAFQQQTAKLARAVLGANAVATETMNRLQLLQRALQATPAADAKLQQQTLTLENRLRDIQTSLTGDRTEARRHESSPPSLLSRLNDITGGLWSSSLGDATTTQKHQYEIVASGFSGVLSQLRTLVTVDVKQLEDAAEAAGAPWTSGRFPTWQGGSVGAGAGDGAGGPGNLRQTP